MKYKADVEMLKKALRASWSSETSYAPATWDPKRAALGQCAVTALVVQDYLGGTIQRGNLTNIANFEYLVCHFWNRLQDGSIIDLTSEQFPAKTLKNVSKTIYPFGKARTRHSLLKFETMERRYAILKRNVEKNLMR